MNLMITSVENLYTAEYIANAFWNNHIAKVSKITLIPYLKNSEIYNVAYITIQQWGESEAAYNFIQRINQPDGEARLVHHDEEWFPVQLNTHNNGDLEVGDYTTIIPNQYYERVYNWETINALEDPEVAALVKSLQPRWQEFSSNRPICGLYNDHYNIDEAIAHLAELKEHWNHACQFSDLLDELNEVEYYLESEEDRKHIETEIEHFENELRIHDAVNKSANVSTRTGDFGGSMNGFASSKFGNVKCY